MSGVVAMSGGYKESTRSSHGCEKIKMCQQNMLRDGLFTHTDLKSSVEWGICGPEKVTDRQRKFFSNAAYGIYSDDIQPLFEQKTFCKISKCKDTG